MDQVLLRYERVDPITWVILASLLTISLYFKFNRFWSVRNVDLIGLILLAPPLLVVQYGLDQAGVREDARNVEHIGYIWLLAMHGLFLLRLLLDAAMVRRPLLEPNLSAGGLTFLGLSLGVFLLANVAIGVPEQLNGKGVADGEARGERSAAESTIDPLATEGPGFPPIYRLPHISTRVPFVSRIGPDTFQDEAAKQPANLLEAAGDKSSGERGTGSLAIRQPSNSESYFPWQSVLAARIVASASQLAIVLGIVLVGLAHFDNVKTGIAAAALYLLLPYTSMWTGSVMHALPGALVVWAIVFYRRPLLAGAMIGLACGAIYYPVFLLPLWVSFYWRRGLRRFLIGAAALVGVLVLALALLSNDLDEFLAGLRQMFAAHFPIGEEVNLSGAWKSWDAVFRYPILAAFIGLSLSLVLWPVQKNLGTLIALSAAVLLGTQFWHAHSGGLALAWYLPLLLLAIFRPNLEDRTAAAVVR